MNIIIVLFVPLSHTLNAVPLIEKFCALCHTIFGVTIIINNYYSYNINSRLLISILFWTNQALFVTNRAKNNLNTIIRDWSCWILYFQLSAHFMKNLYTFIFMCTKYSRLSEKYFAAINFFFGKFRFGFPFKFFSTDWN